jgi:hypothetical protein
MSAATTHGPHPVSANQFLGSEGAVGLLAELRRATDGRAGDRLSGAIRAVTTSGTTLPATEVDAAIAAITLLLSEYDPTLLDGADDEPALRHWLHNVDTELTPGRMLAASAALARMQLNLDNEWYAAHVQAGTVTQALAAVHRLRDGLADASSG